MYDRLALLFVVCKDCYQILSRVMPWLQLRFDYDPTTTYRARLLPFDAIRREQKINMSVFRRSRIVVESQSNRTCDIGLSKQSIGLLYQYLGDS